MSMSIQNFRPISGGNIEASRLVKHLVSSGKIPKNEIMSLHTLKDISVILNRDKNALNAKYEELISERSDLLRNRPWPSPSRLGSPSQEEGYNKKLKENMENIESVGRDVMELTKDIFKVDTIITDERFSAIKKENSDMIRRLTDGSR